MLKAIALTFLTFGAFLLLALVCVWMAGDEPQD
jgi:hypothetical protein